MTNTFDILKASPRELELMEKVEQYERFLHMINTAQVAMNGEMMKQLISNADAWSYAHRVGNGELSDEEQEENVRIRFEKLCDWEKETK